MSLEIKKVEPVALRSVGLDEKWLQDKISDDPSLLGLGDLQIVSREHRQPVGGRIDFLMRDADETFYAVEIMLGTLDESHIIRTIEYWDIERQRRPKVDHCAVIVAESITSRFFNVLRLLNRAVPMIAVQISAFRLNDTEIVIHPVTVLNVPEEQEDDLDIYPVERADRVYWEKNSAPEFLTPVDRIIAALRQNKIELRVTYNRDHIAIGTTTGYNFCWFHRRKSGAHLVCRVKAEVREVELGRLQTDGFDASSDGQQNIVLMVTSKLLDSHMPVLMEVLTKAEDYSHR
jgi:hypothetical protein